MKRSILWAAGTALAAIGLAASGCSESRPCGDDMPESVLVDASAYSTPDAEVEVCIFPIGDPEDTACSAPGQAWASVTWYDEYPDEVGYSLTRIDATGIPQILVSGSYRLQCQPGTVRIELGARPTPRDTQ